MERALLAQSPAGYWVLDPEGRFRYASGNTAPVFGKSAPDLQGLCISEVLPEDPAQTWEGRLRRVLAGETVLCRERRGETLLCLILFPLRAPDGASVYAGGYAQDITALGTAENELRETTLRMLKAQESERGR